MSIDALQSKIRKMKNPTMVCICPYYDQIPAYLRENARAEFGDTLRAAAEACLAFSCGILDALADIVPAVSVETACFTALGADGTTAADVKRVRGMVEKPAPEEAPSTFVAVGRYLLDRAIFDALRRIDRGKGGEYQLTDAIELLIREGHPVHIVIHDGFRHDLGNPGGYIKACVDFGLRHPAYGKSLRRYLERRLPQGDSPDFCDEESAAGAKGAGEA